MEAASALSAVGSAFASTIKIAEKIFEICAVDEQAQAVLQTVDQVSNQLDTAKILRRQKSSVFTPLEKGMVDDIFKHAHEAIEQVAALAERVRADMTVSKGKIRMGSRFLFVLRDSPKVHVSLTQLSIASSSLSGAVMLLSSREGRTMSTPSITNVPTFSKPEPPAPPAYEDCAFLTDWREKNLRKRASVLSMSNNYPQFKPPDWSTHVREIPAEQLDRDAEIDEPSPMWRGSQPDDFFESLDSAAPAQQHRPQSLATQPSFESMRYCLDSSAPEVYIPPNVYPPSETYPPRDAYPPREPNTLRDLPWPQQPVLKGRARTRFWLETHCE